MNNCCIAIIKFCRIHELLGCMLYLFVCVNIVTLFQSRPELQFKVNTSRKQGR